MDNQGKKVERPIADQVVAGMWAWAVSKGATHFAYWFHPLTGETEEKHDSFINILSKRELTAHQEIRFDQYKEKYQVRVSSKLN